MAPTESSRVMDLDFLKSPVFLNTLMIFTFGSFVALLRSIVDGTRRTVWRMTIGILFGGLGAVIADKMFQNSEWHIFWVGAAAVVFENLVVGLFNASVKFREDPLTIFERIWKVVTPNFGGATSPPAEEEDPQK